MEVNTPLYVIGIKDKETGSEEIVKKHIAIEILLNILFGQSSRLYKKLYNDGVIYSSPMLEYEFAKGYAHVLITGQAKNPEIVFEEFKNIVRNFKENGIDEKDFIRIRKMIYGSYIKEYDGPQDIARMFLADYFKGINSFEYLEEIESVNIDYAKQVLENVFNEDRIVLSVVKS